MSSRVHRFLRRTPARYLFHRLKMLRGTAGQSDEAAILARVAIDCPKTFVEFGFHPTEYNCSGLAGFQGLLVDGDAETVHLARRLLPNRIEVQRKFLTLENLHEVAHHFDDLGVLSIDVDGNDYWFMKSLLEVRPHVIAVEYNASLGLEPISVPYDPAFERHKLHPSGWYHGASITALSALGAQFGMKLVAVSRSGGNAFFMHESAAPRALDPVTAYRENELRNRWSGTTAKEQWSEIRHMPFVRIDAG